MPKSILVLYSRIIIIFLHFDIRTGVAMLYLFNYRSVLIIC